MKIIFYIIAILIFLIIVLKPKKIIIDIRIQDIFEIKVYYLLFKTKIPIYKYKPKKTNSKNIENSSRSKKSFNLKKIINILDTIITFKYSIGIDITKIVIKIASSDVAFLALLSGLYNIFYGVLKSLNKRIDFIYEGYLIGLNKIFIQCKITVYPVLILLKMDKLIKNIFGGDEKNGTSLRKSYANYYGKSQRYD
ncbi:hypothetical protein ACAG39_09175 [Caldicellulosiruptoraceae bacterium PP1]